MITINVNFLKAALLFASDEETRYYLKGVHLLRRGDHLRITATDGHRLFCAMQTPDESGPDFDVILPRDGLKKALTGVQPELRGFGVGSGMGRRPGQARGSE
jgi:DNA polymerase III sliding clamp (beta) subunit (PCNA family)